MVGLFYNDLPWGTLNEPLQARSHLSGHRVHVLSIVSSYVGIEMTSVDIYNAQLKLLYTFFKISDIMTKTVFVICLLRG